MREWIYGSIILDFGTRWRWVVSFMALPLCFQGNSLQYPLDRRLGGPQSRSGRCWEEENLLLFSEINLRSSSSLTVVPWRKFYLPSSREPITFEFLCFELYRSKMRDVLNARVTHPVLVLEEATVFRISNRLSLGSHCEEASSKVTELKFIQPIHFAPFNNSLDIPLNNTSAMVWSKI
jgi:hypothetical protein